MDSPDERLVRRMADLLLERYRESAKCYPAHGGYRPIDDLAAHFYELGGEEQNCFRHAVAGLLNEQETEIPLSDLVWLAEIHHISEAAPAIHALLENLPPAIERVVVERAYRSLTRTPC